MSLGEKLLSLRKKKGLSQEEVADLLHVTRQTVSKWETDQSTPDFDKVVPICKLYDISTEELFGEVAVSEKEVINSSNDVVNYREYNQKKALYTTLAVMLYILSIVVIIFFSVVLRSPIVGVCVFFLVIAIATGMLIYIEMTKPMMGENISKKEKKALIRLSGEATIRKEALTRRYFLSVMTLKDLHSCLEVKKNYFQSLTGFSVSRRISEQEITAVRYMK